ncbi:transposase [Dactylosporangium salmoneum]|uniref:transposase n=1 Tax=Dactylosporangium salmoneum TaxID=53361 RepID=UPI003CD09D71
MERWCPDALWEIAAPLIPPAPVRAQGGGRRRVDDRAVLAAICYLTQTGCFMVEAVRSDVRGHPRRGAPPLHRVDRGGAMAALHLTVPRRL